MSSRQEKLEACATRILSEEGVPPFREHANELIARTMDVHGGSAHALARTISKDLGLTSQVLRAANSPYYNHSGRTIQSVPHGIALLGWETLRHMASTVSYVEHYASHSPGLRELMLLSMLSAVHGREVAWAVGYPNPEEAQLCGLVRNLGEVLIGRHCPVQYAKIILTLEKNHISQQEACLQVLDFTWDELAERVATSWSMPRSVSLCFRPVEPHGAPAEACLASIANYARELTHALYREGAGVDALELPAVFGSQGRPAEIALPAVRRIAGSALEEAHATLSMLGVPATGLGLDQQAEKARRVLASAPVFDSAGLAELEQAAEAVAKTVHEGDFELKATITTLLDAVRSAGFDRAIFALLNEECTSLRGRLVSDGTGDESLSRFQFALDRASGTLRSALQRRTDILVDRLRDGRYDRSVLVKELDPAAFALYPILSGERAVGCLYADRQGAAPGLDAGRVALGHIRDVMADAIRRKSTWGAAH